MEKEDVVIAKRGLVGFGRLEKQAPGIDAAFTAKADDEAAAAMEGRRTREA